MSLLSIFSNLTEGESILLLMIPILIIAFLIFKYLNGDFSYNDIIVSENKYKRIRSNMIGLSHEDYVMRVVIKRIYGNGKVTYRTEQYNI